MNQQIKDFQDFKKQVEANREKVDAMRKEHESKKSLAQLMKEN